MFYNTSKSVFSRMQVELGLKKDVVATAPDRDSAEVIAENLRNEIEANDLVDTGRLLNSVTAVPAGGGEYAVKAADYLKYNNGRIREQEGEDQGPVDVAVNDALIDGYEGQVTI